MQQALQVQLDLLVRQAQLVQQALQARAAPLVQQALQVQLDLLVRQARQAQQGPQVLAEQQVQLA